MAEQVQNTGGPADGATVTPNTIGMEVLVLPPRVAGAAAGILIRLGYPQQRVETLLDVDTAAALVQGVQMALGKARAMDSGLILPGMNG